MVAVSVVASASTRAVTVTVWASFQAETLKVRAPVTATTPVTSGVGVTVTALGGAVASTTV